jgi:hypothetical protein
MDIMDKYRKDGLRFNEDKIQAESGCDVYFTYMTLEQLLQEYPEAKHYPLDGDDPDNLFKIHNESLVHWIKVFAETHKTKSVQVFTSGIWCNKSKVVSAETQEFIEYRVFSEANFHLQVKE